MRGLTVFFLFVSDEGEMRDEEKVTASEASNMENKTDHENENSEKENDEQVKSNRVKS